MRPSKKIDILDKPIEMDDGGILRLEDENRALRGKLKELQRETTLFQSLAKVIKEQPPFSTYVPYKPIINKKAKIQESCVLCLSDLHSDQEIRSNRVQGLEEFNFEVAAHRMETLVNTTISHITENMTNYKYDKLYIMGLGDYVSGSIHDATQHTYWKNDLKNSVGTGELIAEAVIDFARYFKEIIICSVSGNHGRRSLKKDYRQSQNNFDYLTMVHCGTRLKSLIDQGRVKMFLPDSWSMMVNIEGWNFVLNHGDDNKSWNGIPFYSIERGTRRLTALGAVTGEMPNYYLYGHFHTTGSLQTIGGEIILNGNFSYTDEYAYNKLSVGSQPFQWLMGCHQKYGLTWRMPIQLRSPDWKTEEKDLSKNRYKINIFDEFDKPLL